MDFSKFDEKVDIKGLQEDIEKAAENNSNYKEVPLGKYEVRIEKMELTESKKGDPMVSIWFKILSGEYTNSLLFFNQVITQGFQIHVTNELLRSLDSGIEVEFTSYTQYANLIMDIHEAIDGKLEYGIEYGETSKGFKTYKITDVFEV